MGKRSWGGSICVCERFSSFTVSHHSRFQLQLHYIVAVCERKKSFFSCAPQFFFRKRKECDFQRAKKKKFFLCGFSEKRSARLTMIQDSKKNRFRAIPLCFCWKSQSKGFKSSKSFRQFKGYKGFKELKRPKISKSFNCRQMSLSMSVYLHSRFFFLSPSLIHEPSLCTENRLCKFVLLLCPFLKSKSVPLSFFRSVSQYSVNPLTCDI